MGFLVREHQPGDAVALRQCVVVLQEFERTIDLRLRPGEAMADATAGISTIAAAGQTAASSWPGRTEPLLGLSPFSLARRSRSWTICLAPYALVTDLVVLPSCRGRGKGRQLLERAEAFVRAAGARELRIGVLVDNIAARRLYLRAEFVPHLEVFTKRWSD
jgi:GNAT superfamily N-acetyltransferase